MIDLVKNLMIRDYKNQLMKISSPVEFN